MMLFPLWFFSAVIYAGIVLGAIGALVLILLFARDFLRRSLW